MIVLFDSGSLAILTKYFGSDNVFVKLFTNDIELVDTLTASSFTEAAGGGYTAKTVLSAAITKSVVGGIAQAAFAQQVFEFTGALTGNPSVYGYYVVNESGTLIFADKSSGPYTPSADGVYVVTPVFQLSKGTPA